jgi:hypothetical protein
MGFKIIREIGVKKEDSRAVGIESVRQTGFNAMFMSEEEQEQCLYKGGKIKVRLKDCDQNVYYHAYVDDDDFSCELLLNWGQGYAGATDLDLHMDDYKKLYGDKINYPNLISKDGKWFALMG